MQLFYSTDIKNGTITLTDEENQHCTKVLRKKHGDEIMVTDGQGNLYKAQLTTTGKSQSTAAILHTARFEATTHPVQVAVAPTKNTDRMEWMVEKLVEIGVDNIAFVQCRHSERKVLKTERLKKIALSAMKQSLKYYLPEINELENFEEFVKKNHSNKNLFIGYCEEQQTAYLPAQPFTYTASTILIGPEGDFAPEEVELAKQAGFVPVSLGQSRLRTETAAIVAATLINATFEKQNA